MLTHTISVPAGTTNLNDIATGSYTDTVTGIPIPGTTMATASASVQSSGNFVNATANITDAESISGAGLTFSVPTPSFGGFVQDPTTQTTYSAATQTTGPVDWSSGTQSAGNSI